MGEIIFERNLPVETVRMVLKFLKQEHGASIRYRQNHAGNLLVGIEGKGIPPGRVTFSVTVKEIVPNVLTIEIYP